MAILKHRVRPEPWSRHRERAKHRWSVPFIAIEWVWAWLASGANLSGADLRGANLAKVDLRDSDFRNTKWQKIESIKLVNIFGIKDAPPGFLNWAIQNGAIGVTRQGAGRCRKAWDEAAVALNDHRQLLARCGSSFHIRPYQISHASKSKLNTHPVIKNTGIHAADRNPLGMF
jgi:hypothetical protein